MKEKEEQKVVILRSTFRGMFGLLLAKLGWLFFWTILGVVCWKAYATQCFGFFAGLGRYDRDFAISLSAVVSVILVIVAVAAVLVMACALIKTIYAAYTVNYISKDEGKIIEVEYDFPFKKSFTEIRFDRIIKVTVAQGSVSRMLGTGSIHLKLITNANADSLKSSWSIMFVHDPFSAKEKILAGLPDYTGLSVKII